MIVHILIVLASILLASWLRKSRGNKHRLPPGPKFCLPFLGHLLFLGTRPHRTLLNWSKKYGPVFSLKFGSFPAVVISNEKLIKQALSLSATAGRLAPRPFDVHFRREGIVFGDGHHARDQRRFAAKTLKNVANIGESMESRILKETDDLIENSNVLARQSVQVNHFFHRNKVNSVLSLAINQRFEPGHPRVGQLLSAVAGATSANGLLRALGMYISRLCNWLPKTTGLTSFMDWDRTLSEFYKPIIEEHIATGIPGQLRDVMDVYLETVEEASDPQSSFQNATHLVQTFKDFFSAGVETTSVTLEWVIFLLDQKLSCTRQAVLRNRLSATRTNSNSVGQAQHALHGSLDDFELLGYMIPKESMIIPNLFAVHHDPDTWGDPEVFLEEHDRISLQTEPVVAFRPGKRSCIGEGMARNIASEILHF